MRSIVFALLCWVAPLACGGASPAPASSVASSTSSAPAEAPAPRPSPAPADPPTTVNVAAVAPLRGAETTDGPDGGASSRGVAFGTGNLDTGFGSDPRPTSASTNDAGANPHPRNGGLSPDQVRLVVMTHVGAVRACYESEAQHDPSLKGGVTVQWTIDAGGKVTSASVVTSTLGNPRVEGCVVRQVRSWRFPSSETPTTIAGFPFKFGVGG